MTKNDTVYSISISEDNSNGNEDNGIQKETIPTIDQTRNVDQKSPNDSMKGFNSNQNSYNKNEGPATFPVDLSCEEYIRFNLIVSKTAGLLRFRKSQIILFSIMIGFCFFMMYSDMLESGRIDGVTVLFTIVLAVIEGIIIYGIPIYVRRSAGRMYEQTIENGHSYYGVVTVYSDRMEKRSAKETVRIRYQENAIYIETWDMMILMAPNTPAIVLPARCLNQGNADDVRRAVLAGVLPQRQSLMERMIPTASGSVLPPDVLNVEEPNEEENTLMEIDVAYTREEFIRMALTGALHTYLKILPAYCLMAVITGLLFGMSYNFGLGIIVFLFLQVLFFGVHLLGTRAKAGRLFGDMPNDGNRVHIRFTEQGLQIRSYEKGETVKLTWSVITRAVERPDSVEFYTKNALFDIPKRCINDMNGLREIVDAHHQTSHQKNR